CGESDGEENLGEASASLTVSVEGETYIGSANCTFVNSVPDDEDEPAVSNLSATKVCVGEGFDATFEISAAGVTRTAGCGATVSAEVEPGAYEVGEAISGPDADAFTTLIVCNDGTVVQDTSATVTVGPAGLACVVINVFDPDASEDLSDL